jgi:ATP-binding cassette subfamily A (ABC1) protein 3
MKCFLEFEYRLFIEKKEICNTENVTRFIRGYIHDVVLERETSLELIYGIKRGASQYIGRLINALDEQRQDIGINGYGLSMTTIEEVFLR